MGRKEFEVSLAGGVHAQLARMAGQWSGFAWRLGDVDAGQFKARSGLSASIWHSTRARGFSEAVLGMASRGYTCCRTTGRVNAA